MDLTTILNNYCRKIGIWFLGLLPIFLTLLLFFQALLPTDPTSLVQLFQKIPLIESDPEGFTELIRLLTIMIYIILIIVALPFAMNGFFMEKAFNEEIKRIMNTGLLIQGVEGFDEIQGKIKLLYRGSYSVSVTVIISFLVFLSAINLRQLTPFARIFIFTASIGLLAISSGASLLLRLPDKSALHPGGLMKFYSPKSMSLRLDNLLSDSIFTQLDPITRIRMDEWSRSILDHFNPKFLQEEKDLDDHTRLERAREKIFLMVYLRKYIPTLMTEEILHRELNEIISPEYISSFIEGWDSGISLKTLTTIIHDIEDEIPHIFELVQRIFVLVTDNLRELRTKEEYVTICYPTAHIGNIDPFKITVFVLNLQDLARKVIIQAQTSMSSLDPDDASQMLTLDTGKFTFPSKDTHLEFSSTTEPFDILRLVSAILQVGDALNFQFRPNRFGTHVLNISIDDPDLGILVGRSIVIDVHRDLRYYVKTMGGKVIGYLGAALSFIGIGLGGLAGIFVF
jgi:hypothetical protein